VDRDRRQNGAEQKARFLVRCPGLQATAGNTDQDKAIDGKMVARTRGRKCAASFQACKVGSGKSGHAALRQQEAIFFA
jgi:hypothetical protein